MLWGDYPDWYIDDDDKGDDVRGRKSKTGDTRTAANGYHYTRTKSGWVLTHRITAEQKLGRSLAYDERVRYVDGDRSNFNDPDNLNVYKVREASAAKRKARIEARIDELQAQLLELEREDLSRLDSRKYSALAGSEAMSNQESNSSLIKERP